MADDAKLLALVEANTKQLENALKRVERATSQSFQRSAQSTRRLNQALDQTATHATRLSASLAKIGGPSGAIGRALIPSLGSITAALSARAVIGYADAWKEAGNRLAAASQITGKQARSLDELNKIANESRSSLGTTVELYSKLLLATKDVAASEEDVARATEIVSKAFKAGGASAGEQAAGILQLSQALASGVLQGDELRSIRENAPLLARAIAQEFNTTIGGLKALGAEGELTADRILKGILRAQGDVEQAFDKTQATVADSLTKLNNAFTAFVGKADAALGVTASLTNAFEDLARVLSAPDLKTFLTTPIGGRALLGDDAAEAVSRYVDSVRGAVHTTADLDDEVQTLIANLQIFPEARRFVTDEQFRQLEQLRELLAKQTPEAADAARVALDRLAAENPRFEALAQKLRPLIDALIATKKAAEDARGALHATVSPRDAETASMAALGAAQSETQKFLDQRTADAKRTEDERALDQRTDQILKEAEKVGLVLSEAAARIQAKAELAAENVEKMAGATTDSAARLIAGFESFRSKAYFDVNHFRVGFGSDTMTDAAGRVSEVTRDSVTTVADAYRDLTRRIAEIQKGIINDVGADAYNRLSEETRASLISVAYNYGQLPKRLIAAVQGGDPTTIAAGIEGLAGDNGGVNRRRRFAEAANILGGPTGDSFQAIEQQADAHKRFQEEIQRTIEQLGLENAALSQSDVEAARNQAAFEALRQAKEEGLEIGQRFSTLQELEAVRAGELTPELEAQRQAILALANAEGVHAQAALDAAEAQQQLADSQQAAIQQADGFRGAVKDVLGGFISDLRQGKSLAEALGNALNSIADKLINLALDKLISGLFGPAGTPFGGGIGGFLAGLFHEGGIVGEPGPQRLVPASAFAGARRYHSGGMIGAGEVPAILKRGEVVLPSMPALRRGGGNDVVTIRINPSEAFVSGVADKVVQSRSGTIVRVAVIEGQKHTRANLPGMMRDAQLRQL